MINGSRIEKLLEELGWSQAELARRVDVSQQTVWKLVSGKSQGSKHLHVIARALGTSPEYLMGDTEDPSPTGGKQVESRSSADREDTVELQELDLAYGMGGTFLDDLPIKASSVQFNRAWLRNFTTASPDNLFFARGAGDSMQPTIQDSDIVLIDRSQDTPRMGDQIWAISFGGVGMIKRLRPRPDGSIAILSDNPAVPEDRAVDDEMFIIGRVVAVVRKI